MEKSDGFLSSPLPRLRSPTDLRNGNEPPHHPSSLSSAHKEKKSFPFHYLDTTQKNKYCFYSERIMMAQSVFMFVRSYSQIQFGNHNASLPSVIICINSWFSKLIIKTPALLLLLNSSMYKLTSSLLPSGLQ